MKYKREQLESMTMPELVTAYNKTANKPVKKFKSKTAGVERILASQVSAKQRIRNMLSELPSVSMEDLVVATGASVANIRTVLSDLKSTKYCGKQGPMSISSDGGRYSCG